MHQHESENDITRIGFYWAACKFEEDEANEELLAQLKTEAGSGFISVESHAFFGISAVSVANMMDEPISPGATLLAWLKEKFPNWMWREC